MINYSQPLQTIKSLFPPPDGVTIGEVVIFNQTGQKVLQGKPVNNTLDISKIGSGIIHHGICNRSGGRS